MVRKAKIVRKTKETNIELEFTIDGSGIAQINTPAHFFNHLLESFTKHGNFNLKLIAEGDIETGLHHLIEDIGICLGKALNEALADKKAIERFGFSIIPMDETEITVSIDLSGRSYLKYDVDVIYEMVENMETIIIEDFFRALASNAFITLHITKNCGLNSHHILEAIFKAFARALKGACVLTDSKTIPSTKGLL
ncbi:MAG: imidazoleglycerol-phosphate dehydratase HisB [Actinobacteria bacterium]|nr:imidazoleglycerol-phosphate dehydratase HisB [Actinomycetota bacterium]